MTARPIAHKPDEITVKDESSGQFTPCPEDQHNAVCVDVINLGERVETYPGQPTRIVAKLALVYQVEAINEATGKRFEVAPEFTISMNERAGLRKWLQDWRGKAYTDDQVRDEGVPIHKLVGQPALLTVNHKQSVKGRTYAKASNITRLPKGLHPLSQDGYERGEYWGERRKAYGEEVKRFRETEQPVAAKPKPGFEDFPDALLEDEDDSLPF